ncbi:MAG: heme-binding domain-containing protein [Acidobacteria bacterium]|nr:heme-binding domain-containing protein [Acidobacteriota bacterium]
MKKALKITVIVLAVAFIVLQFFRIDTTAPVTNPADTLAATTDVPPDISLILGRSCDDCHTNNTRYPWYAQIQPTAWFLKNHIDDGRRHLNFSIWNSYDDKKKAKKLDEVCEEVQSGEMPLPSYLWIHHDAVLNEGEKKALCAWSQEAAKKLDKADK